MFGWHDTDSKMERSEAREMGLYKNASYICPKVEIRKSIMPSSDKITY